LRTEISKYLSRSKDIIITVTIIKNINMSELDNAETTVDDASPLTRDLNAGEKAWLMQHALICMIGKF